MLNTPKIARRKRGYLLNRLNTRKFAVAVDIAGKYHLDGALLDGHRRGPSPQQIIAQRLSAAIRQARRVLIDNIGKDTAAQGQSTFGKQVVADHHDLTGLAGRDERVGNHLGTNGKNATNELRGVRRTQALFELMLELFDLRMGTCKILNLPWNITFAQVIVEGAGG